MTQASIGTISNSGAAVNISGTLTNTGSTLTVGSTGSISGNWSLVSGGTIIGGTLAESGTGTLALTNGTLNGVALASNFTVAGTLSVTNGLTLNNVTLSLGNSSRSGQLTFSGSQTFGGTGTVLTGFASETTGVLCAQGGGSQATAATLTIGPNITISNNYGCSITAFYTGIDNIINQGTINSAYSGGTVNITAASLTNQGTISASNGGNLYISNIVDAKGLSISGGGTLTLIGTWMNSGTLTANASTLTLNGTWTNTGTLSVTGGTLNLGGTSMTQTSIGTISNNGTAVNITGTLTNTGSTLTVGSTGSTSGNWTLYNGGTIIGGTLAESGTGTLTLTAGTLNGVTVASNLTVAGTLTVTNGLTLNNAALTLGTSTRSGELLFPGSQTLGGTGTILLGFANETSGVLSAQGGGSQATAATLTIGPNITVTNNYTASITVYYNGTDSIINQGTINSAVSGESITITGATVTNQGTIGASNGGSLYITNLVDAKGLSITGGGVLDLLGTWANSGTISLTNSTLDLNGTAMTVASIGTISNSGGSVNIDGTLNNTGTSLTIGSSLGNVNLVGGTITGGTLAQSGTGALTLTSGTLNGVTVASNLTVAGTVYVTNGLTLNGVTLTLGRTTQTGQLTFQGSQTLGGTGTVVLGQNGQAGLLTPQGNGSLAGAAILTIGANITVTDSSSGFLSGYYVGFDGFINQGTINTSVSGQTLNITGGTFTNQGTINTTNGANLTITNLVDAKGLAITGGGALTLSGTWANSGTITVTNSTLNLGGTAMTPASIGTINNSGGTVKITGTLNNMGTTFTVGTSLGNVILSGGTINGGTLAESGTGTLTLYNGTINAVAVASNLTVTSTVYVTNGLTLNNVTLSLASTTGNGDLTFQGSQTLGGTGTLLLGLVGHNSGVLTSQGNGSVASTLTIGANITVTNTYQGIITGYYSIDGFTNLGTLNTSSSAVQFSLSGAMVTNQGTINAPYGTFYISATTGQEFLNQGVIDAGVTITLSGTGQFINQGVLDAQTSDPININGSVAINGTGALQGGSSGDIYITGNLLGSTQNAQAFSQMDTVTFRGSGTSTAPQLIEAMSQNVGAIQAGLIDNFAYGTLALSGNTYAQLVDQSLNAQGSGAQSVYANEIIVPAGSTLDLNGLTLYAKEVEVRGTVINGIIMQIPSSNAPNAEQELVTSLHSFGDNSVPSDGHAPAAGLIQGTDGYLYGMTPTGGSAAKGAIFRTSPSGQVVLLHSFGDASVTNDGASPAACLLQATDGNFYGTTPAGGLLGQGVVFKMTARGAITILHSFPDSTVTNDGATPQASLIQGSDGNFYGTTSTGGAAGKGTVFMMTPSGTMTILHSFGDSTVANDGLSPSFNLVQANNGNFYGTTPLGGSAGAGTVFKITAQGAVTILHSFQDQSVTDDGSKPLSGLIQYTDGNFYGTTNLGGSASLGCAYKITSLGQITILYSFGSFIYDGLNPASNLLVGRDGYFYGTTTGGGSAGEGAIYQLSPQGLETVLHSFGDGSVTNDGNETAGANGLVQASDGNFYGTTALGGSANLGAVYQLVLGLPEITSPVTAQGTVSLAFNYQTTATNLTTHYTATGLPNGLSIDPNSGLISGTPTASGNATATITLTNAAGTNTAKVAIAIAPLPAPSVTSILYALGSLGNSFSYSITGNNNTISYGATGLTNTGLSLDSQTGVISGTPTATGTFPVSITTTNSTGTGTAANLTIKIFSTPPTLSQEYFVLHPFNNGSPANDGQNPFSILQGFDGTYYGTTTLGGANNAGEIFNMTVQGTASSLFAFNNGTGTNLPAVVPEGIVQAADGNFYGVTQAGGTVGDSGNFFKVSPQGVYSPIYDFNQGSTTNDGVNPQGAPVQGVDGNFYGVTTTGGAANKGAIYRITPGGLEVILHSFGDGTVTNDGLQPVSSLIQGVDGNFYGTTPTGGVDNKGTIFELTPQGAETILHSFGTITNDGANPAAALVQGLDGNFYGTTQNGGANGKGTVFQLTSQGETVFYSFGAVANDGANPVAALIQGLDGNFYGTTLNGGSASLGTLFQITPAKAVTIVHNFGDATVTNDGANPAGNIYQDINGNFFGTTLHGGGTANSGTAYVIVASQSISHVPVFYGAAYGTGSLDSPFSYTPKALFQTSVAGTSTDSIFAAVKAAIFPHLAATPNSDATSWAYSGTLPGGMTFNTTTGATAGVSDEAGTFTITITPHNSEGFGVPRTVTLYIAVPPVITSSNVAGTSALSTLNYSIIGTASPTIYGATNLPAGLSVDVGTGLISGSPPGQGSYAFNVVASNFIGPGTQQVVLTVTGGASSLPAISSATTASGAAGTAFSYQIAASNNPTGFSALSLPVGLLFDSTSGLIYGTPTTEGVYSVPVYATNGSGSTAAELTITIAQASAPTLASTLTASATQEVAFTYQIPASGLVSIYSAFGLPSGLAVNPATGVISGTPTTTGTYSVVVAAANETGSASGNLSLSVAAIGAGTPVIESSLVALGAQNVPFVYQISATGSPTTYAATGLPTGLSVNPSTGLISGTPTGLGSSVVTLSASNGTQSGSATLNLTVNLPLSYGSWLNQYPTLTGGATGTPKNDTVPNLFKYISDINPLQTMTAGDQAALPKVGVDKTTNPNQPYLSIYYRRSATLSGTAVNLQSSTDLVNWTSITPDVDQQAGTDPNSGDPIIELGVKAATTGKQFIRLDAQ